MITPRAEMIPHIARDQQEAKEKPYPYSSFLALTWTFTAIAIILTVGRFAIRKRTLGKLRLDDWTHAFATVVLCAFTGLYSALYPLTEDVELHALKEGPAPTPAMLDRFFRLEVAGELLFWIVLYTVKATFLVFYRQIFGVNRVFTRYWWGVTVYTIISFLACFLSVFWGCATPDQLFVLQSCISKKASVTTDHYAEAGVALNISSDLAIMILPIWMLKGLHMSPSKKLGLTVLFSVGLVVVILDACRIAEGVGGGVINQASNFNALEPTMAVIVSALPVYRALFPSGGKSSRQKAKYENTSYGSSQQSWRIRITARHGKEGYELSEDAPDQHLRPIPAAARSIPRNSASKSGNSATSMNSAADETEIV